MQAVTDEAGMGPAVYRKVAWRVLPLLGLGYLFAYMDRVNIGFAAAQMNADLKFSAAVYSFGGGLFFLSYALMEIPSNLLFQRFGARLWISRIMLTWGLLAAGMIFVKTPVQFYIMRLLLGAAEAGFFPAVVLYLARWFPLQSRARALSTFYVAFPLSSLVMGALSGGLLGLDGQLHIRGWQWLLLVEGLPAVLLAIAIFLKLPERPDAVTWLSDSEKHWLKRSLGPDETEHARTDIGSIFKILSHPLVLILGLANGLFLGTGYAFTLSGPQVLGLRTGFDVHAIGLLVSLGGLAGAAAMIFNGWLGDRTGRHFALVIVPLLALAAGYWRLATADTGTAAVVGYLLTILGSNGFNAVFFVLVSRVLQTRDMVVGVAAINMIAQLGSFVLPSVYGLGQAHAGRLDGMVWALPIPYLLAAAILVALSFSNSARETAMVAAKAEA